MHIQRLQLKNYRNYGSLKLDFSENINILYGDNAQGKTNILEAIFLCSSGRSHRTSKDADLIRMDQKGYFISADFIKESDKVNIEISYLLEEKRKIRINEIPVKKLGNLMGQLNAVIFSPEDLMVIKEGPSERRRFIDITLCQLKPSYFYDLQQYMKVLHQRNSLLKDIQKRRDLMDTLEVWNNHLVVIGSRIMKDRKEFIERLNGYIEVNHKKLTMGKEELRLQYSPSVHCESFEDVSKIKDTFQKTLEAARQKELIKASTMYGPQRDDYELFLNGMNLKQFGSQGQQRTAILSVKLSEVDLMKEDTGEYPVLLLDDVMSELDRSRQEYLIQNLKGIQTFITSTDIGFMQGYESAPASYYHVTYGKVE